MKIWILTDNPYHDNETVFGAYSTEEKARAAMANSDVADRIIAVNLDLPPCATAAQECPRN